MDDLPWLQGHSLLGPFMVQQMCPIFWYAHKKFEFLCLPTLPIMGEKNPPSFTQWDSKCLGACVWGKNAVNRSNHFQLLRTEEESTLPFWFWEDKKTCLYQIASHCPVWKHELWISSFMWGLLTQPKEVRTLELSLEANSLKTHHSVWTYFPESA